MIRAIDVFTVECNACKESYQFFANDAYFEEVDHEERSMGLWVLYFWEEPIKCKCGQDISIKYSVAEYPKGSQEGDAVIEVTGAKVITQYNFVLEPE